MMALTVPSRLVGLKRLSKMGAYKEIFIKIQDNSYNIGRSLIESSEEADLDEIKQSLREAIKNSALALAFIAEMELL